MNFLIRFGVCCVFILSNCASIVTQNCTYVRNPGFPSAIDNIETCKFTIHKSHSSIYSFEIAIYIIFLYKYIKKFDSLYV